MNKKHLSFATLLTILWAAPAHANIAWPGFPVFFIVESIYKTWFLIFGSIIIEALFFLVCIKNISFAKSLGMSLVGNIASTIVGTIISTLSLTLLFPPITTFDTIHWFVSAISMCLSSALIELAALRVIFRYKVKELFIPVLAGNIATYALTWLYFYWYFPDKIPTAFRFWEYGEAPTVVKKARRVSR